MMTVLTFLLSAVYIIACLFLIFVVLIQKGEGGGLGGLAGGGAGDGAFGAKADMTWKRATGVAAALFVGLSLVLGGLPRPTSAARKAAKGQPEEGGQGKLDEALLEQFARALERVHVKLGWTSVDQHPLDLAAIAQLPGVVAADEGAEGDLDAFWERLRPVLDEALARLVAMRREEGRGIAT